MLACCTSGVQKLITGDQRGCEVGDKPAERTICDGIPSFEEENGVSLLENDSDSDSGTGGRRRPFWPILWVGGLVMCGLSAHFITPVNSEGILLQIQILSFFKKHKK